MALSEEQVREFKKQLLEQIQHLPPEQKQAAQQQIDTMSPEALESMLKQQMAQQGEQGTQEVFRAILDEKIPSKKIAENKEAVAVLDIKPIARGHTIVIPRKQAKTEKDISQGTQELAKEMVGRMKEKLKVKDAAILPETKFGETILNVIPVYEGPVTLDMPRTDPSDDDLAKVFQELYEKPKPPLIKLDKPKQEKPVKMGRKIP